MSVPAISVEALSKRYRIGLTERKPDTFVGAVGSWIRAPLQNYRALRKLSTFGEAEDDVIWAVRDVSFEVAEGEVLGIIGRNGAGKSTLLKILSRITEPTRGRAVLSGRVSSLLEVGTGFHPELTGRENVYLNGTVLGMTRAEIDRKFDEIVEFSGVARFLDTPVKRYSSGMKVRLAFAVAAHLEPEILLVDEVLSVGDVEFQRKCLGRMGAVAREGRTVLLVSHNLPTIGHLCTRTILMDDGHAVLDGPTSKVIAEYLRLQSGVTRTPLSDREDRIGLGALRVSAIEILDGTGRPLGSPASGQEVVVRTHYRGEPRKRFVGCQLTLMFHQDEDYKFILSTELSGATNLVWEGEGHVDFVIPAFPLPGGTYFINTILKADGQYQDTVERAAELAVIDGDFFGTGRIRPDHQWRVLGVLVPHTVRVNSFV